MAKAIENTPIISGEDVKNFRQNMSSVFSECADPKRQKELKKEQKKMNADYNRLNSLMADGSFKF